MPEFTVIARTGAHDVLSRRHEVMLVDGRAAWLHRVNRSSVLHRTLRTLAMPAAAPGQAGTHLLFDLQALQPGLDAALCEAPERDHPGTVMYALRRTYTTLDQLVAAVRHHSLAVVELEQQRAAA